MHAGGHTIGLYGDRHDRLHSFRMPGLVREDLLRAARAVEDATGVRPRFFRPPLGHTSITTTRDIRRAGMIVVGWSVRGLDGLRGRRPEPVVARVTQSMTDGAIVLLHDAAEHDDFEPAYVRALPELLRLLDERGWTSVGLDTPLATPSDPAAGRASSPAAHAQEASDRFVTKPAGPVSSSRERYARRTARGDSVSPSSSSARACSTACRRP
jgi:hypothetical protein